MRQRIGAGPLAVIVGFSLRYRGVVIALAVLLAGYGIYQAGRADYDVFPEFAPPQVSIQTEAPGLAPEQVEVLVTQTLEDGISGVPGLASLRSQSIQGLSVVTATFDPHTDIYRDRQNLAERLVALAGEMPEGVQAPVMSPLTSSTSVMMVVGLTSQKHTQMELRTLADWIVKPRLLAAPGVSKVAVFGGEVKQYQVQVEPQRLRKYDLSLGEVADATRRATGVRGAGFIDNPNQRIVLQSYGQEADADAIAGTLVRQHDGANVTLGDLARVREAAAPIAGAATVDGAPGVQLVISEQYGANTLAVTQAVEQSLAQLRPAIEAEGIELRGDIFRPANFIETATANLYRSLAFGGLLVVAVVVLFLYNWRTSVISLSAIPLSLLAAVTVMNQRGISLNTMTLGGLAIAIGLLVDDAIIVVENVHRRLREHRRAGAPGPLIPVVLRAVLEVRSAVVYATLAIALVFLPVLTLPGLAGRLFSPLAAAYLLATLASLLVAITVTPALCLTLLPAGNLAEEDAPPVRWLKRHYRTFVGAVVGAGGTIDVGGAGGRGVLAAVALFTLLALALLPFLGGSFLPELKEGHYIVHMTAVPGTSLQESLSLGRQVNAVLLKLPFVRSVNQRVGRAELADDTNGTHESEFEVPLKPLSGVEAETALADIRSALVDFPGVNFAVNTFLTERVEETLSGYTAEVVVKIYGDDLDTLDAEARRAAAVLNRVRGAADVQIQAPPGMPEIGIRLRPQALARWGFDTVEVLDAIETAGKGQVVGQVYNNNQVFDLNVILAPEKRRRLEDIRALPLRSDSGRFVRLEQLADVYTGAGRYLVLHDGARRVQAVTANVSGRDVTSFVAEAKRKIAGEVQLAPGHYIEFGGTAQAQAAAQRDLLVHSLIAAVAVCLMLWIVLGRARNLALVLLNLPFGLAGGVIAAFAAGGGLSLGALVGFVTLFGITLRNSVMLLSHYEYLVSVEGLQWGPATAARGAEERLAPILMTALATALGLLPLAIGSGDPGREIEGPMAWVILGGLFTSTALNLLVMPSLALRYGRFESSGDEQAGF